MSAPTEWLIHLTHTTGCMTMGFKGTREEADAKAASYIGKPASWNCTKRVHEPNLWDTYTAARVEERPPRLTEEVG